VAVDPLFDRDNNRPTLTTVPRKRGLSHKSPWEILKEGTSFREAFSAGGIPNVLLQGGEAIIGSRIEEIAEGVQGIYEAGIRDDPERDRRMREEAGIPENAPSLRESPLGTALFGDNVPASLPPDMMTAEQQSLQVADIQDRLSKVAPLFNMQQLMEESGVELSPELQAQLDQVKLQAETEINNINEQIAHLQGVSQAGSRLFASGDQFLEDAGVIVAPPTPAQQQLVDGATDLLESAVSSGENLNAAIDAAVEANLDAAGLSEVMGREFARAQFERQLRQDVNNLVQNKQDIEKNVDMVESALLKVQANEPPMFNLSFDPTPHGMFVDVYQTSVLDYVESQIPDLSPQNVTLVGDLVGALAELPESQILAPTEQEKLDVIATELGIDPTGFRNAVNTARTNATEAEKQFIDAPNARKLVPGSQGMTAAIFQIALEEYGDPQIANQIANNPSLHALIGAKSNGAAGFQGGGNQRGVGALNEEVYQALGMEWSPELGMGEELRALILYLQARYGGDANAALVELRDNGSWGDL
jgi:hypothetical protein